jgi:hypothetical protein
MSSLAQQLKKIGTADANRGSEKAAKHRASFLFDSKQAADYDIDTIYSIGVNGITELRGLDSKFAAFDKTLFSESMKSVDRVLQVWHQVHHQDEYRVVLSWFPRLTRDFPSTPLLSGDPIDQRR